MWLPGVGSSVGHTPWASTPWDPLWAPHTQAVDRRTLEWPELLHRPILPVASPHVQVEVQAFSQTLPHSPHPSSSGSSEWLFTSFGGKWETSRGP